MWNKLERNILKLFERKYYFRWFCFLFFLVNLFTIDNFHSWSGDYSLYLSESRAILDGSLKTLEMDNIKMMNNGHVGPYLYPIGYPIIILPLTLIKSPLIFYKLLNSIFLVICLITAQRIYQKYFNEKESQNLAILFFTSNIIFYHSNRIESDIFSLMLFSLSFLYYLSVRSLLSKRCLLFCLFSIACLITRTAYLPIYLGLLVFHTIWDKNKVIVYGTSIVLIVHLILNHFYTISNGENEINKLFALMNDIDLLKSTFLNNSKYYFQHLTLNLVNSKLAIFIVLATFNYLFSNANFKKFIQTNFTINPISVVFVVNIFLFSIWPHQEGFRFIWVNMLIIFGVSLKFLSKFSPQFKIPVYFSLFILISLRPLAERLMKNYKLQHKLSLQEVYHSEPVGSDNFNEMITFIRSNAKQSDIILARDPRTVYYFAKRISYLYVDSNLNKGHFVITDNSNLSPIKFQKVYTARQLSVYKILNQQLSN